MTSKELRKTIVFKRKALKEYKTAQSEHRKVRSRIDFYTKKLHSSKNREAKGIDDMQPEINYWKAEIDVSTRKELSHITKRKLLAIKHARDNGYLKQHEIEY